MNFKRLLAGLIFSTVLILPAASWSTHPLIADDAGTQGKGKFQLELNCQYDSDKDTVSGVPMKNTGGHAAATLSYGIAETVDLVLTLPYSWGKTEENEAAAYDEKGISDTVLETKWRFFEREGYSLALKPGIRFPTGNDEKGLGAGKVGSQLFLIGSKELGTWAFQANMGYIRNENKADEQKNLWHASLAATWTIVKNLKLVGNVGIERNPDENAENNPAFLLGGLIYKVTEYFDIDCGVKYGLNSSENDFSVMAGIAIRF